MKGNVISTYAATTLWNTHRRQCGLKDVNAFMVYTLAMNGEFFDTEQDDRGRVWIDPESFTEWMIAHDNVIKERNTNATEHH